jgi:tellurite resistance protein
MFLNQLSYQEKKMFLDLSVHVAKANSVLTIEEKELISQYCTEMQMPAIELYETEAFETVTDYFALADDKVKKIVLLEILGLAYVDGKYDEDELRVVKDFVEAVGVSQEDYDTLHQAINEYYKVCCKLAEVIE